MTNSKRSKELAEHIAMDRRFDIGAVEREVIRDGIESAINTAVREALDKVAREFECTDITYWKPKEIMRLILSLKNDCGEK